MLTTQLLSVYLILLAMLSGVSLDGVLSEEADYSEAKVIHLDAFAIDDDIKDDGVAIIAFARGPRTLHLDLVDIFAPGAVLGVETDEGRIVYPAESGSYRGTFTSALGEAGIASLTIHPPYISASLIGLRHEWIETVYRSGIITYISGEMDTSASAYDSEGERPSLASHHEAKTAPDRPSRRLAHGTFECGSNPRDVEQIVPHADRSLYLALGSDTDAVFNRMEADTNNLNNFQYDSEVCINLQILGMEVHTMANDPLSSTIDETLLQQFAAHFLVEHDDEYFFDVANLFTGKNLFGAPIGASWREQPFSLCQQINKPGGGYMGSTNPTHRRMCEGHEIGHNYDADEDFAALHPLWTSVIYETVMWGEFLEYSLLDEFSDTNSQRVRDHSPKANR